MDNILTSFQIEYNTKLLPYQNNIFQLTCFEEKYFLDDFQDNFIEIKYINPDKKAINFLKNVTSNYCFLRVSKKNKQMIVTVYNIFKILRVGNLNICNSEIIKDYRNYIRKTSSGQAILLANNVYNIDNEFLLKDFDSERAINIETFSKDNDYFLSIKKNKDSTKKTFINNLYQYQLILLVGDINFVDGIQKSNNLDVYKFNSIKLDTQSYLNLWQKYNIEEINVAYNVCIKSGVLKYKYCEKNDNKYTLFIDDGYLKKMNIFKENDLIYIGYNSISNLFHTKNYNEFHSIETSLLSEESMTLCKVVRISEPGHFIEVFISKKDNEFKVPKNNGILCLSLLGNSISYKRREDARTRVLNGRAGMKNLVTFFTDEPIPNNRVNSYRINDAILLPKSKKLTYNQRQAIEIIMNTPDIAIIQGPPGTGKTTVIREALNQINALGANDNIFATNLLTGFKKDTVSNLIKGTTVFGLPAINIFSENTKIDDALDGSNSEDKLAIIKEYVSELIKRLKEKYSDITYEQEKYIDLKHDFVKYLYFGNSIESSIELLNKIKNSDYFKYDYDVTTKLDQFINELSSNKSELSYQESIFLDILYALPIFKEAYLDSKDTLLVKLNFISDIGLKKDVGIVKQCLEDLTDFEKIKKIRKDLILKYMPKSKYLNTNKKAEIVLYIKSLFGKLDVARLSGINGDMIAICDFMDSLMENPQLIYNTILKYTKVVGATNQYSVSKEMVQLKDNDVTFNNVFIDEAATSSPLDLFIPMSVAKDRIILVGDHKQLPNIVDEDIIDTIKIDNSLNDEKIDNYKTTLFEVLMGKARKLEQKDGFPRVITLDTQFRMHPKLGEIVSTNFYNGQIKSRLPASVFKFDYNELTNYLYWYNIPMDSKQKYRINKTSRVNIPEANAIAMHIKEALDKGTKETIGVITLYRDQKDIVTKALKENGVNAQEHNILIGTVDAFQGREFDIVYLSMTYVFSDKKDSNNYTYSRLTMDNADSLLCVALSRQIKCLIIVGDMNVYDCDLAKNKVPKIYNICHLCKERDWIV